MGFGQIVRYGISNCGSERWSTCATPWGSRKDSQQPSWPARFARRSARPGQRPDDSRKPHPIHRPMEISASSKKRRPPRLRISASSDRPNTPRFLSDADWLHLDSQRSSLPSDSEEDGDNTDDVVDGVLKSRVDDLLAPCWANIAHSSVALLCAAN